MLVSMKCLKAFISNVIWFYALPLVAFAHESDEVHEEPPASIDPVVAVMVVVAIAVAVFLIWKFVLNKKEPLSSKPS